jgi:hypothetical protein
LHSAWNCLYQYQNALKLISLILLHYFFHYEDTVMTTQVMLSETSFFPSWRANQTH